MEIQKIQGGFLNEEIHCMIHKINSIESNIINHWFGKGKMRYVSIYESAYFHFKRRGWEIAIGYFKN